MKLTYFVKLTVKEIHYNYLSVKKTSVFTSVKIFMEKHHRILNIQVAENQLWKGFPELTYGAVCGYFSPLGVVP